MYVLLVGILECLLFAVFMSMYVNIIVMSSAYGVSFTGARVGGMSDIYIYIYLY